MDAAGSGKGLKISRCFTKESLSPFDQFIYERRSSVIRNPNGSVVFEMKDIEVPSFWTQVATDILAQKYFRKAGVPLMSKEGKFLLDETGKMLFGSENSIKQVAHRLAGCWRHWGEKFEYFDSPQDAQRFYEEMVYMLISQTAAPNSPQWFTTGLNWAYGLTGPAQGHSYFNPVTQRLEYSQDAYTRPQAHACFIQTLEDDLVREGGIFSLLLREARIFKYGSGTGSNFSKLRGKGETLTGGGSSSGLMSFLKIFDTAAGSIKSGGTTRRAAKMVSLDLDHPEIENFVWWKVREEEKVADLVTGSKTMRQRLSKLIELAKNKKNPLENKEVQHALKQAAKCNIPVNYLVRALDLAKQGYELPLQEFDTHYESEAYLTVSGQNSNNSVRIPNTFFEALKGGKEWKLVSRNNGSVFKTLPSRKLWDDLGYCAWASADPGVQFDTTINEWHTCPESGRINGSNPCSEFMFLDDTACNLASINLVKLYDETTGVFDLDKYRHVIRLWTIALEISVLMAQFPSEQIALNSYKYRALGLGFANLGTLLMLQGIPYDSNHGRTVAGAMAAIMTGEAYTTSAEMADILGPFEDYPKNQKHMLRVIRNHRRAAYGEEEYEELTIKPYVLDQKICPSDLLQAAHDAWGRALELGQRYGFRNAQVSVIAPTGCILGGSLVATEKGLLRLKSLGNLKGNQWQDLSFSVLTDDGPRPTSKFFINGLAQTRKIRTHSGYEIQGTPNHQIKMVTSEGVLEWRKLEELKPGDVVPLSLNLVFGSPQLVLLPPLPEMHWNSDFETQVPREMNPLLAELIGYFMGDGSLHSKGIRFCVTNGDDDVVERIKSLARELFHLECNLSQQEGYVEVAVHSVPLAVWWEAVGFAKIKPAMHLGGKGYQPHIPEAILWTNNKEVYTAFLRGLFEADGTVTEGTPAWCTADLEFSQEIKTLLLGLGFPTTTKMDISGWGQSEIYSLRLRNRSYCEKFRREIGFISGRKTGKILLSSGYQGGKKDLVYIPTDILQTNLDAAGECKQAVALSLRRHQAISRQLAEVLYQRTNNPGLLQALQFSYDIIEVNEDGGLQPTYDLSVPENLTYLANGFISHNTIGLVMDCDTTGIEPDYALVKYKKLAGGGFFKIVNQSVPLALKKLGYEERQIRDVINYCLGHGALENCPVISKENLRKKGFNETHFAALEKELKNAMDLRYVFKPWVIGEELYNQISGGKEADLLETLGFLPEEIAVANDYVCGTMTLEGAPHLKEEHLPIFDCASKCGKKGRRYIHPYGHLKMVAAVQAFISGAISKTINMPKEWTVEQVKQAYYDAWSMMIKGVALYRDGCKLSQPLNTTLEENEELRSILEEENPAPERVHKKVRVGARELALTGHLQEGKLSSVQVVLEGMTPAQEAMTQALVNMVNLSLKRGTSPKEIVLHSLKVEGHPIILELAKFLSEQENTSIASFVAEPGRKSASEGLIPEEAPVEQLEKQKCSGCGATQLRRNGTCLLCEICGETSGCS